MPDSADSLPDRQALLNYLRDSAHPQSRREIARAFKLGASESAAFKAQLKELERAGLVSRDSGKLYRVADALPQVAVVEVTHLDADSGTALARPASWTGAGQPPRIRILPPADRQPLQVLDRLLIRIERPEPLTAAEPGSLPLGRIIRRLAHRGRRILGVVQLTQRGAWLKPTDRRERQEYVIASAALLNAQDGDLVLAETLPDERRSSAGPSARVVEVLGDALAPRAISLIAIATHGIPDRFPDAAIAEAEACTPPGADLGGREDLRAIPLVTIDGEDARDFDDAVFAEPDPDPANPGGHHLIVAIADVAAYVLPGSALDREAQKRGNSTYFPDRVVPMLPEALSNDLCSLRPHQERESLAVHLTITAGGLLKQFRFCRARIRSVARLTYTQVQAAISHRPDAVTEPLLGPVIQPLYAAYRVLAQAREARGTLELDIPELKISLDHQGRVAEIRSRERLDSHKLIEEFMILANVAAATALSTRRAPCLYRIHDRPDEQRLYELAELLRGLGIRFTPGQSGPAQLSHLLQKLADQPLAPLVSTLVLRAQAQARYALENIGHFGLQLERYAHFTSPIRRYADLAVHRSLIRSLDLPGGGGLIEDDIPGLSEVAQVISDTERRSALAERDSTDRYVAAYLSERIGEVFAGRISGVTTAGLFVKLAETGADGFVPIRTLPHGDFYALDERSQSLVGRRWGRRFQLAAPVRVRIREAVPVTGGVLLEILDHEGAELAPMAESGGREAAFDPFSLLQPPTDTLNPGGAYASRPGGRPARSPDEAYSMAPQTGRPGDDDDEDENAFEAGETASDHDDDAAEDADDLGAAEDDADPDADDALTATGEDDDPDAAAEGDDEDPDASGSRATLSTGIERLPEDLQPGSRTVQGIRRNESGEMEGFSEQVPTPPEGRGGGDRDRPWQGRDRDQGGGGFRPRRDYGDRDQGGGGGGGGGGYRPRRDYGDRPQGEGQGGGYRPRRDFGDRPQGEGQGGGYRPRRDFGDRPQGEGQGGDRPFRPRRDFGDRPQGEGGGGGGYGGDRPYRPRRDFGDRPQGEGQGGPGGDRPFRPRRDFGDRPQGEGQGGDRPFRPRRDFGDRPQGEGQGGDRPFRPRRDFGDRPQGEGQGGPGGDRPFRPRRDFGDRPQGEGQGGDRPFRPRRDFGDRPQGEGGGGYGGDRPFRPRRDFGDRPQGEGQGGPGGDRPFRPRRDFGDRPQGDGGPGGGGDRPFRPRRDFGDRPQGDGGPGGGGDRPFRPRRDFGDRPQGDGGPGGGGDRPFRPRRDFGDRPQGDGGPGGGGGAGGPGGGGDRPFRPRRDFGGAPPPSGSPFGPPPEDAGRNRRDFKKKDRKRGDDDDED